MGDKYQASIRWGEDFEFGWVIFSSTLIILLLISRSGGARGIVELEVLKAIEMELGGKLEIQAFLDLMVGTRYVMGRRSGFTRANSLALGE
jgi:hypothetical protein